MKKAAIFVFTVVLAVLSPFLSSGSDTRGINVVIKDSAGKKVGLYKESHALLIGVSDYTAGWPKLESVPFEIDKIEASLKKRGFHVVKVMNPNSDELYDAFEDFIDTYGFDEGNRLLFYFSGHGHTRKGGKKGYLVPADAPDPRYDEKGFVRKAIGMNQILTWSRVIEAKHALFLFDSCFSGTVFKAKALPKIPPDISDVTTRPVRQFISAGSAGEEVPARSVFTPMFIRALEGEGDLDADGFITGTEIGLYLHKKVLSYGKGQTPQYGKIKDPDLDQGDFVFIMARAEKPAVPTAGSPEESPHNQNDIDKEFLFWQSIQNSDDPSLFEAYIEAFPDGVFTPIAESKVEALKGNGSQGLKPKLFVNTVPETATVRILNIKPKFYQGMDLAPGSYHVEVSHAGYETQKTWVKLEPGANKEVSVNLDPLTVSKKKEPPKPNEKSDWIQARHSPARQPVYHILLWEKFSDNGFKWPVSSKNERVVKLEDGKYYFRHNRKKQGWTISKAVKGFNAHSDFKIEVRVRHVSGIDNNGFGIVWGKGVNSSFHFRISANGYFKLSKTVNGKFVDISKWKKSSKINRGNVSNLLSVEKKGNTLYCYINGGLVYQSPFETFAGNKIGFRIDKNQAAEFDNLMVKVAK